MNAEKLRTFVENIDLSAWLKDRRVIAVGILVPVLATAAIAYFALRTETVQSSRGADQDRNRITLDSRHGQTIYRNGEAFMYVVAEGETAESLSQRFGMGLDDLRIVSGLDVDQPELIPGQVVAIILRENILSQETPLPTPENPSPPDSERMIERIHIVQPGERLWSIARLYNVDPVRLVAVNRPYFPNVNLIHPGDQVIVPAA